MSRDDDSSSSGLGCIFGMIAGIFIVAWYAIKYLFKFFVWIFRQIDRNVARKKFDFIYEVSQMLNDQFFKTQKMEIEASNLLKVLPTDAPEVAELRGLISYCQSLNAELSESKKYLDSFQLDNMSNSQMKKLLASCEPIKNKLSKISYPVSQERLLEIKNFFATGGNYIYSLVMFSGAQILSSRGQYPLIYRTQTLNGQLNFDPVKKIIEIKATPIEKITSANSLTTNAGINPSLRHDLYFNSSNEIEFKIVRHLSEIDHYDIAEIFEYMERLIAKKQINPFAEKKLLAATESSFLNQNTFPIFRSHRFTSVAPPPADLTPDIKKLPNGTQRWAQLSDLRKCGLLNPNGFLIGKLGYGSYVYTGPYESHILTIAPSGSGKGVGVVIPNLLRHSGSAVVLDPKGENLIITSKKRSQLGNKVFYYDPWGVIDKYRNMYGNDNVAPEAIKAHINPLDFIRPDDTNMVDYARMMAASLIIRQDPDAAYFYNGAETFITQLIIYICSRFPLGHPNRNMLYLRQLVTMPPRQLLRDEIEVNYTDMIARGGSPNLMIVELINWLKRNTDAGTNAFNNIYDFAIQGTEFMTSPQVSSSLLDSNVPIMELKKKMMSLYLILDTDRILFNNDVYTPLIRLIITTCMLGASTTENSGSKLLFMLDEIAQLGNLQYLPRLMAIYRSRGVVVWTIWQNLEQIQSNYPDEWKGIIGNCDVQQYFGINDQDTARMVSEIAGNTTILKVTTSSQTGTSMSETTGSSETSGTSHSTSSSQNSSYSATYKGYNSFFETPQSTTEGRSSSTSSSTTESSSQTFSRSIQQGTSTTEGISTTPEVVPLITPEQVRNARAYGVQFVFYSHCPYPILSGKIKYYDDLEFYKESSENVTIR